MFDPRNIILRSLRYHSPNDEIRESFIIKNNTIYCTKPHLLEKYNGGIANTGQESEQAVGNYIRKSPKNSTGRRKVKGYKRQPKQMNLEDRLLAAEPPEPFVQKALMAGFKNLTKYMR